MNHSIPGLHVHHQLPESTQTQVHCVGDAIQPSHPLSSPSPPALNLSQLQGLFQRVDSSHQVAKVLEFQLQHQSFQWTPKTVPLGLTGWISLQPKGLSRVFSNTTVQKRWKKNFVPERSGDMVGYAELVLEPRGSFNRCSLSTYSIEVGPRVYRGSNTRHLLEYRKQIDDLLSNGVQKTIWWFLRAI